MSIGFIEAQSIYATKSSRRKIKKQRKQALTVRGGTKKPMDIVTTRLLDGRTKKRMHYQASPERLVTTVMGVRIVLGNERTYTQAMLQMKKGDFEGGAPEKEARVYVAKETCVRLESKEPEIKLDKFGFKKNQGSNGRRVQKHGANTVFK